MALQRSWGAVHGALQKLYLETVTCVHNHAYTTTAYTTTAYTTHITTTALWISPLTGYFVPVAIALGLFLNIPLILMASTLLYMFTASINGRRRSRPDSGLRSSLRSSLYNLCSNLYSLRSLRNSLCSSLYSLRSNLRNSLLSSLYGSLRATALVVTSCANPSNLIGLKLARSAVKIKKFYAKGPSRCG